MDTITYLHWYEIQNQCLFGINHLNTTMLKYLLTRIHYGTDDSTMIDTYNKAHFLIRNIYFGVNC